MGYNIGAIDINKERDDLVSEKLAETYLPFSPPKKSPPKKTFVATALPLAASVILAVMAVYLFATHNIAVDISINKKGRSLLENLLYTARPGLIGSSILEDNAGQRYAVLIDDGTTRRAALIIDFQKPIDLSREHILINTMPKRGGGRLRVVLRDENFRSYVSNVLDIHGEGDRYENFIVGAQDTSRPVNIKRINQIRLELEKDQTKTSDGSSIYIKTVGIVNN